MFEHGCKITTAFVRETNIHVDSVRTTHESLKPRKSPAVLQIAV